MQRMIEQRYAIKFCVKLKKSSTETLSMIREAYGEDAMSKTRVFEWHKRFKEGREDVEDEQRAGRPSTSRNEDNVAKVKELLDSDRRLNVRMIAEKLNLLKSSVHSIVSDDLQMRKVCAKLVPKVLSEQQKEIRVSICHELLERVKLEPDFLDNVITGDETWVFEYDPETKRQSTEWHTSTSPRPKKARMIKSKIKSMLIVFFDSKGIVHREFVPAGQTVTGQFYMEVLERLRIRIRRVRREIADTWILHHDNAPSHTSLRVREFLAKHNVATLPQPPFSSDLAPPDFFLFPRMKQSLKGHHYGMVKRVQAASTQCLKEIPVVDFQRAYQAWQKRWQRCIDVEGSYFEEF